MGEVSLASSMPTANYVLHVKKSIKEIYIGQGQPQLTFAEQTVRSIKQEYIRKY